jgi:dynein heavy chain
MFQNTSTSIVLEVIHVNAQVSILQNGIKMTNEPAKGIRLNIKGTFLSDPLGNEEFFYSCAKPAKWFKLCYALAFFHAVIQERRSFGALGWNIPYEFTAGDFSISCKQIKMMLDQYDLDQFKALNYLIGECNYGGRVTDDKDRRYLLCILADFLNHNVFDADYNFSPSGVYAPPEELTTFEAVMEFNLALPLTQQPEVLPTRTHTHTHTNTQTHAHTDT